MGKKKEKKTRVTRPPCPKCKTKMRHFIEGRVDTWICGNPKCGNFDYRLSKFCPACDTTRMRTENDLWVCLNPECPTYAGDIVHNKDLAALKRNGVAKATELAAADAEHHRAKRGQGTRAAASARRRSRAKEIDEDAAQQIGEVANVTDVKVEGLGDALLEALEPTGAGDPFAAASASPSRQTRFLNEVERTEPIVDHEEYFHPATKVRFRRRIPNGDDALLNVKLPREERVLRLLKRLRGPKNSKQAAGLADELLNIIAGEAKLGDWKHEAESVTMVQWSDGTYRVGPMKLESWKKKKEAWGKRLSWRPKRGSKGRTAEEVAKARHEEVRGKIRITIQNGMKKADRNQLVDGDDFEVSYIMLHGTMKREIWPGDDVDPKDGAQAPIAEWQRSAYPDFQAQA